MRELELSILKLSLTPGLGARSFRKLVEAFGDPSSALQASSDRWRRAGVEPGLRRAAMGRGVSDRADSVVARCEELGIGILTFGDGAYPAALATIFDPPPVLYLLGRLPPAARLGKSVAIVGTRKASDHGLSFTYRLSSDLIEAGAVIVSGLALGIDAEAHRAAVDRGGIGIGVLAGGLDRIYPWANRGLAERLCENGCLLSEHPPGTAPQRGFFAGRNRLISGLARALAVVEAGENSGALLTVEFALEQGRPVFIMPGRPGDRRVAGSLRLLGDGATLLLSAEDIASEIGLQVSASDGEPLREVGDDGALFGSDGTSFDAMLAASGLSAPRLLARLGKLEMDGRIRRGEDGLYYRS